MRLLDLDEIYQTLNPGEVNDLLPDGWRIISISPSAEGPVYILGRSHDLFREPSKDDRDSNQEQGEGLSQEH